MQVMDRFQVLSGSIPGRDHVRCQRNNQDAVAVHVGPDTIGAVVADGCSSGASSEVGARLAVRWLAGQLPAEIEALTHDPVAGLEALGGGLVEYLEAVLRPLAAGPERWPEIVRDYGLFTLLGVVVTPARTLVFGLGDGLFSIDGRTRVLESGPDNAPPYLGYRLLEGAHGPGGSDVGMQWTAPGTKRWRMAGGTRSITVPGALSLRVLEDLPTDHLRGLLIATDGALEIEARKDEPLRDGSPAGGLEPFLRDDRYLRNPSLMQKRLVVLGELNQRMHDDTTLVVIRRKEG